MKSWLQSSLVVFWARRLAHGSVVVHGCVTVARLLVSDRAIFSGAPLASSVVMTQLIPWVWRSGPAPVAPLADGSRVLHAFEQFLERVAVAWRESATNARLGAIVNPLPNVDAERVRLAGWLAVGAGTTHILLVGMNALVADAAAGLGWVAVIPLALACIRRPEAVVAAWQNSRWRQRALYRTRD